MAARAWYAEDIAIGYGTGYFNGTSPTLAEPETALTREQAITVLARNLRLEEAAGEVTNFRDGRNFSNWSRGYVKTAVNRGLVNGYEDGSFRPGSNITRGEMTTLSARWLTPRAPIRWAAFGATSPSPRPTPPCATPPLAATFI